ncbi:hypothetical protein I302_105410 [Kwoniella bestiolae CBS 10118]|uniref:Uncharacterized protein n=1 Tax=Kwoniella bestiolae CBS 10118 TaxID=1296100 RepID=A0A1B9FT25_9TREE|nr:hypothetical protein I302_08691 [Kwoniella bestiolae CBS 10118]OCF21912.1 hypothetical protein I302_08691 [Kwoniella bestiolae CBS 10118]
MGSSLIGIKSKSGNPPEWRDQSYTSGSMSDDRGLDENPSLAEEMRQHGDQRTRTGTRTQHTSFSPSNTSDTNHTNINSNTNSNSYTND